MLFLEGFWANISLDDLLSSCPHKGTSQANGLKKVLNRGLSIALFSVFLLELKPKLGQWLSIEKGELKCKLSFSSHLRFDL